MNALTRCLSVRGFVSRTIRETLALNTQEGFRRTFPVAHAKRIEASANWSGMWESNPTYNCLEGSRLPSQPIPQICLGNAQVAI